MNMHASPNAVEFHGDASLSGLVAALGAHRGKELVIEYGGRKTKPGYHVTEVKAGSFVTLDCGGNPDEWKETVLQVEDPAPTGETTFLAVSKFLVILAQVGRRLAIDGDTRVTFEIGPPDVAMQVFDAGSLSVEGGRVVLGLHPRSAICKPRHREARKAVRSGCCR